MWLCGRWGRIETFPIATLMEPPPVTTSHAATAVDAPVIARVALLELHDKVGLHIYGVSCGIIMNRYRYAPALSDNIRRAAHNDLSWMGAEV